MQDLYEENIESLNPRPPDIEIFHALGDAIMAYPVLDARRKLCAVLDNCINLHVDQTFREYVVESHAVDHLSETILMFAEKEVEAVASTIPQLLYPEYQYAKVAFYIGIWQNIQQNLHRFPGLRLVTLLRAIGNAIQKRSDGNMIMRYYLCTFFQWVLDHFNSVQESLELPQTEPFSFIEWVNRQPTPPPRFSLRSFSRRP